MTGQGDIEAGPWLIGWMHQTFMLSWFNEIWYKTATYADAQFASVIDLVLQRIAAHFITLTHCDRKQMTAIFQTTIDV